MLQLRLVDASEAAASELLDLRGLGRVAAFERVGDLLRDLGPDARAGVADEDANLVTAVDRFDLDPDDALALDRLGRVGEDVMKSWFTWPALQTSLRRLGAILRSTVTRFFRSGAMRFRVVSMPAATSASCSSLERGMRRT